MRIVARAVGPICLAIGAALLVEALASGGARLYLLVFIPVFTGTTLTFGFSVLFLVMGFLLLPFSFVGTGRSEPTPTAASILPSPTATREEGSGGMILVGPVPIFFGSWRRNPPMSYRWAVLLGAVLAVVAILLLWGFSVL
jgi:uncharacterized membrane protein